MSEKNNKKGLLRRKIISIFFLVSIITSNFSINTVNAMPTADIPQNIWNITKDILNAILEVGEGVLKAGIATSLNLFAQDLAMATVDGMATGSFGSQPLFFQFPLEDMLKQTLDQVTGDYLDKLSDTLKYDLCKPIDAELDWRFKITLNILPQIAETKDEDLKKPNCTISKFVDSVNKSFENISSAIRGTFAADCFDEFLPKNVVGINAGGNDIISNAISNGVDFGYSIGGALANFTYDGIKDYYLYNVSSLNEREAMASYFTKKATYYLQKDINPKCISYSATTDGKPGSYYCKISEDKNANKTSSCVTKAEINFDFTLVSTSGVCMLETNKECKRGSDCSSGICIPSFKNTIARVCSNNQQKLCLTDSNCGEGNTCDIYNVNQGTCITYDFPDKTNNVYQADKTKQKKFLTQYKTCYLTQMETAFKSLIEVGQAPKQKIQEQKVKIGCTDIVDSLLTSGYDKNAAQFYGAYDLYFKKNFWGKDTVLGNKDPELYKTVLRSALLSKKGYDDNGVELNSDGTRFLAYLKSKINFFEPFEQALVNCSRVSGSGASSKINVSDCINEEGRDGKVSSNDSFALDIDTETITLFRSDFRDLMIKAAPADFSKTMFVDDLKNPTKLIYRQNDGFFYSVGLRKGNSSKSTAPFLSLDSNSSKINEIKKELVDVCISNAKSQASLLSWKQSQQTKAFIEEQKQEQIIEVENEQEILKAEVAKSDTKAVVEPVSHEVKSTPGMVEFNLEQSLSSSSQMLQPTGDLFMDPIKIFLTTLLSEGSKKLMEGMFSRAFSADEVDEDLSDLDSIDTSVDSSDSVPDSVDSGSDNSSSDDNLCSIPGPVDIGSICIVDGKYNNGICETCYCEARVGLSDSKGNSTYGTCQPKPSR